MSPRIGRPTDNPKNISLQLRISTDTDKDLKFCAEQLGVTRTKVIEEGVKRIRSEIEQKK